MDSLISNWSALSVQKRVIVGAATAIAIAFIMLLARSATAPEMALLYSNLEPSAASEVLTALEQEGVEHSVRGGAIYVPQPDRDRLRLSLAGQGLPANGTAGYELLERMSGFGTTSQMFDAAYWRAKEGELARTIMASPTIQGARVHIAKSTDSPFERSAVSKASVALTPRQASLEPGQARSIQFLVAAAVPGLTPQDVTVVNAMTGRLLSEDGTNSGAAGADERAATLKTRVERLLEARLGPRNFVVEISVETSMMSERLNERTIDPSSRIVVSTDTEERSSQSTDSGPAGGVTVASNLPEGDGAASERNSSAEDTTTRERVNYDFSEVQREVDRAAGDIERITVAVLVDGITSTGEDGAPSWTPRSEAELAALKGLVESAVGFSAERGDTVTIHSMELAEPTWADGTPAASSGLLSDVRIGPLLTQLLLAATVIAIAAFVVRPALKQTVTRSIVAPSQPGQAIAGPGQSMAAKGPANQGATQSEAGGLPDLPSLPALNGTIEDGDDLPAFDLPDLGDLPQMDLADFGGKNIGMHAQHDDAEDPVEKLMKLIEERREETIEVLRSWMETEEEDA